VLAVFGAFNSVRQICECITRTGLLGNFLSPLQEMAPLDADQLWYPMKEAKSRTPHRLFRARPQPFEVDG